jgi:hypothetical protein
MDYNNAICESWKQQMLLNIVRLRHHDAPVFIEVGSIIGGYTVEHQGNIGWAGGFNGPYQQSLLAGGQAKFTDRPTITYTPLTGSKFIQSMMKPVDPPTLLFLIQSGWNAESLFHMVVQTINGKKNRNTSGGVTGQGDPEFFEVARLLGQIQRRGAVGMRIEEDEDGRTGTVMFFNSRSMTGDTKKMFARVKEILGLKKDQSKFTITYGGIPADDTEISVLTRSIIRVLIDLSSHVDVPEIDITEGRARADLPMAEGQVPLVKVLHSSEKPTDAYTSIRYGKTWYWVDNKDLRSKGIMTFLVMLFAIMETGTQQTAPLVTVPAG